MLIIRQCIIFLLEALIAQTNRINASFGRPYTFEDVFPLGWQSAKQFNKPMGYGTKKEMNGVFSKANSDKALVKSIEEVAFAPTTHVFGSVVRSIYICIFLDKQLLTMIFIQVFKPIYRGQGILSRGEISINNEECIFNRKDYVLKSLNLQ
jgi:hypothetical protein